MNKKTLGIVVVILLVLAVVWFALSGSNKNAPDGKGQEKSSNSKMTSLKELEALNKPQKCVFKDESSAEQVQGLVYVSQGKMRGDFGMVSEGKTIRSHMISDGKYSYTWMDDSSSGFKVALDVQNIETKPDAANPKPASMDASKQMSYDCQSWSEDASVFVAPSNVKFEDFSAMMAPKAPAPGGAVQPAGSSAAACAACDSLQGDSKTQCRAALSCK